MHLVLLCVVSFIVLSRKLLNISLVALSLLGCSSSSLLESRGYFAEAAGVGARDVDDDASGLLGRSGQAKVACMLEDAARCSTP